MFYKKVIRPILFLFPPEAVHRFAAWWGNLVGSLPMVGLIIRRQLLVNDKRLQVTLKGMNFDNPIGLGAGFDKDGRYTHLAEMVGFGFMEIGSITSLPYEGNPKPRLRRMKKNNSIIVNYGLKGLGADKVHKHLENKSFKIPTGISVAKSNLPEVTGEKATDDYTNVFELFQNVGNYYTINVSCPNTYDGMPFTDPDKLEKLLSKLLSSKERNNIIKPIFLKINPDLEFNTIDNIISLVKKYNIDGIIIGNLFKDTKNAIKILEYPEEYNQDWPGSISGKPIRLISTEIIKYVYKKTNGSIFIIGCGGVFTGDDAYEKIRAGASLVQLVTGFIYNGPLAIRKINSRLLELIEKDGFNSIKEAIGVDNK